MTKKKGTVLDQWAQKAILWLGTTQSILVHTILFVCAFSLMPFFGFERIMLIVTTIISMEAIYLSLFIQLAVNKQHHRITDIEEDIDDILEDTEELTEEDG